MKHYRSTLLGFALGVVFLMYLRGYDLNARLMGWSVVVGLATAFLLTFMRPIRW